MEFISHHARCTRAVPLQTMTPTITRRFGCTTWHYAPRQNNRKTVRRNSITRGKRCNGTIKSRRAKPERLVVTWLLNSRSIRQVCGTFCVERQAREPVDLQPPTGLWTGSLPICESGIIVIALRHDRDRLTRRKWRRPQPGSGRQASTRHCCLNLGAVSAVTLTCDTRYSKSSYLRNHAWMSELLYFNTKLVMPLQWPGGDASISIMKI